jgi:hypothetical protein
MAVSLNANAVGFQSPQDSSKQTYTATLLDFTPAATPTDIACLTGAAGKKITITQISVGCTSSANTFYSFLGYKRTTLNSGGTPSAIAIGQNDSKDPPPSATLVSYGANPTLGTGVLLRGGHVTSVGTASTTLPVIPLVGDYGIRSAKAIILNNENESYCLNCNAQAVPVNMKIRMTIEWTEE